MKKFLLADGNSMLFRAYYATAYGKPMTASSGLPTNAVFGFVNMLQKALDMVQPDAVFVAFDAGKHTFRHEIFPDYKGGRKPAPDDLVPQFKLVRDLLDAYRIRWSEKQDIEADDLIGTLSRNADEYMSYILTSDHDLLQLADDTTTVLLMKKGLTEIDEATPAFLMETMGITPSQIIDMKGLMGDKSDNIPGIPGIGEKTALKLLSQYGTVEGVLEHEGELKGALQKKIMENHDSARMSRRLAEIDRHVNVDFNADDCLFDPDYESLIRFLHSLDMNTTAARYEEMISAAPEETVREEIVFERVRTVPAKYLDKDCAVFINDDRQNYMYAQLKGIALFNGTGGCYIETDDILADRGLQEYLKAETPYKAGFDIKRAMHICERTGITVSWHDDAMLAAVLCDSSLTSPEKIYSAYELTTSSSFEDIYGKASKPKLLVDEEAETRFACESAANIHMLMSKASAVLHEYGMGKLYSEMEVPLSTILCEMENIGIRCDIGTLDTIARSTYDKMQAENDRIFALAGRTFNMNSPKQLAEVLYDELGLPAGKKRSTSADKLEKLKGKHEIIDHILAFRKWAKLYSTYAEGLKKYIREDGRIHTVYNQAATQTGRLSSSEPNLQNISVRNEEGREIRKAFLPDEGCVLISSDYHQIELRMLAHMADEEGLKEAFRNDIDVHTKTAMDVFGIGADEVTPAERRQAKTVNFGIVYGISDFGLAEQLGVSRKEAGDFIASYYQAYPRIRSYMNSLIAFCEKNGYVETLCGRRRDIPEIHDRNYQIREFGKRAAMNAPIQGSAADLIKLAMLRIDRMMKEKGVKSRMILQVHDELIFNVPEDEIDMMKELIRDGMEHAMELSVPLSAECAVGETWYEAK